MTGSAFTFSVATLRAAWACDLLRRLADLADAYRAAQRADLDRLFLGTPEIAP